MPQIREPKPDILRIEQLVTRIKQGDIKIPNFQRPFVWKRCDILDLFDSVYQGYPIGSILLWLTNEKLASERQIGDLEINRRPEEYPTNYVLDGQQRLSCLCGALYWDGNDQKSKWHIAFDLDKEIFFYPDKPLTTSQFPLNKLINVSDFLAQCRAFETMPNKDVLVQRAVRLLNSIKDYKMAAVTIGDMKISEVAPIFERINSKGRVLQMVDLMRAATWKEGEYDLNSTIKTVREALDEKNFADVPESHILKSLSASADLGIYRESIDNLRDKTSYELKEAAIKAIEGYRKSVDFLTSELGLPSYAYMPYAHQLTLLVEFFRRCPRPTHSQRLELKKWFWRTSFCNYYRSYNSGDMKRDLEIVRAFADGKEHSLFLGRKIDYEAHPLQYFYLRGATSKIYGLMLVSCSPRNLLDGSSIDIWRALSSVNSSEYHHVFPKAFLESSGVNKKQIDLQANICLLSSGSNRDIWDSRLSVYFSRVEKNLGDQLYDVLASNLISREAYEACLKEDYLLFIKERSKSIILRMLELTDEQGGNKTETSHAELMTITTQKLSGDDDLISIDDEDESEED